MVQETTIYAGIADHLLPGQLTLEQVCLDRHPPEQLPAVVTCCVYPRRYPQALQQHEAANSKSRPALHNFAVQPQYHYRASPASMQACQLGSNCATATTAEYKLKHVTAVQDKTA